jgi:signal transduction histidine kinase
MQRLVRTALAAIVGGAMLVLFDSGWAATEPVQLKPGLWRFERAQFTLSDWWSIPGNEANWREVELPESWSRTAPGLKGTAWYRLRIDLPHAPRAPYALYIPNRRGLSLDAYANGSLIASQREPRAQSGTWYSPILFVVPPALLKAGPNALDLAMTGDAAFWAGLGRVTFGETRQVAPFFRTQNLIEVQLQIAQMVTLTALGLFALALWLARRRDGVALWFSLGSLGWAAAFAGHHFTIGTDIGIGREILTFLLYTLLPLFSATACLRAAERRRPLIDTALWGSLAVALGLILTKGSPGPHSLVWNLWPPAYALLPIAFAAWLLATQRERLSWSLYVFAACAILAALFPLHDWLRNEAILDLDRPSLRQLQTVDLVIGLGAIMLERYLKATRSLETMAAELERRVAEKTREIEDHVRREQALREEQALGRERERILADMHDGLGASLVALTHVAENPEVKREELARRARDALQDLRIAIDALESYEGDLATVLGSLRERLAKPVESAGVRLAWEVGELPVIERLPPSVVLNLQRIVLEAVTNALRHAGARNVRVSAAHDAASARVAIAVEDDGRGFDAELGALGHGLRNMRRRAERIGAALGIRSGPGEGTRVSLELPTAGFAAAPLAG